MPYFCQGMSHGRRILDRQHIRFVTRFTSAPRTRAKTSFFKFIRLEFDGVGATEHAAVPFRRHLAVFANTARRQLQPFAHRFEYELDILFKSTASDYRGRLRWSKTMIPISISLIAPRSSLTWSATSSLQAKHAFKAGTTLASAIESKAVRQSTTLLGDADRSSNHLVPACRRFPRGSGVGRPCASRRLAMLRCSSVATSVEPVNITPRTHHSARRRRFPAARQQLNHPPAVRRLPAESLSALRGDKRRLLGRFGQHAVTCRQRRGNLAGE